MRHVCPMDVKKMLIQRARSVYWKKWAAKHEYEELKEGAWLEQALALLRKNVRENWTEKHRHVAKKIFLGRRLDAKKDYSTLDGRKVHASMSDGGRHRKAQALPLSGMARSEARYFGSVQEMGAKGETHRRKNGFGKEVLLSNTHSVKASGAEEHVRLKMWESEKHPSWCMPAEGFKGHVATDGSLLGKWGACGWAVVQLDYDEEMEPLHGMYGSV